MSILIYLILLLLYEILPIPIQIIVFLVDVFVPDPIPFFDELILFIGVSGKLIFLCDILDFITEPIGCIISIFIIVMLGFGVYSLFCFIF